MAFHATRRSFLRTAPLAAATLSLAELAPAQGTTAAPIPPAEPFRYFTAATLAADAQALHAAPGNNNLVDQKTSPFAIVMTTEEAKAQKEFEWHEVRDHIVQILDGACTYEVGGKPVGAHQRIAGEWNSPSAEGATTLELKAGDMLTIPRNTLHKRTTRGRVTFLLISPAGRL